MKSNHDGSDRRNDETMALAGRRDKLEIISEILNICSQGATKTRIVYQANLNFTSVKPYINILLKEGMIEILNTSKKLYKTTDKGNEVLDSYKFICNSMEKYHRKDD